MRSFQLIGVVALAAVFSGCKDGGGDAEVCNNGTDDDGDGSADCEDGECATDAACGGDDTDLEDEDCNNGDDDDGDGDEDCDDSDCADDEDCAPDLLVPYFFSAGGVFGYDVDTNEIVGIDIAGVVVPPSVSITVGTEAYTTTFDDADACTIILRYTGTDAILLETYDFSFDGTDYVMGGFVMPDGEYEIETDCTAEDGKELDTSVQGTYEDIAAQGWGVMVGTFNPDVAQVIIDQSEDETTGDFIGGGFHWDLIEGAGVGLNDGVSPFCYGNALGVSADFEILNSDGDVASEDDWAAGDVFPLDPEAVMNDAGVPPTGAYLMNSLSGWTLGG